MTSSAVHLPELILIVAACVLFLVGVSNRTARARRRSSRAGGAGAGVCRLLHPARWPTTPASRALVDSHDTFRVFQFAQYIKMLAAGVGILLVLLAWPTNARRDRQPALDFGTERRRILRR